MSETVVRAGVTLHAPVLACRPVRFEDWSSDRLQAYRQIEAEAGVSTPIYPGSTYVPCEVCGIEVALGPRQQVAVEFAAGLGLAAHVLCTFDAVKRVHERAGAGETPTAMSLGNPFRRAQP